MANYGGGEVDKKSIAEACKNDNDQPLNCKACTNSAICQDCLQTDHKQHDLNDSEDDEVYDTDKASEAVTGQTQATKEHSSLKQMFKRLKFSKNKHKNKTGDACKEASALPEGVPDKEESNYPLYVAKYEYTPRTAADLGFKKKDLLYVVNVDDEDWWLAKAKASGQEGYIPSNYVVKIEMSIEAEDWFYGAMSRLDAEKKLMFSPAGSFLVHDSVGRPGSYSLSVKDKEEERVRHYVIRFWDDGRCFITRRISFDSIPELVDHYIEQADGLCVNLRRPCIVADPPQTAGLSKDVWDIEWSSIRLHKMLGASRDSTVWEGQWNNTVPIAVRVFDSDMLAASEFRKALALMRNLRHRNLVQVLAACTQEDPAYPIFMAMELSTKGSLLDYLRGDGRSLKVPRLLHMGTQIANGMAYLEDKMYPHGNLAAKNVLLSDNLICKVADYGISQDHLYTKSDYTEIRYSLKWAAPEVLASNQVTIKSDVWSFGILLYELITYGHSPYPGVSDEVLKMVKDGYRMSCPMGCPQQLYEIMRECWKDDATSRPTFETLQWRLEDMSSDTSNAPDT